MRCTRTRGRGVAGFNEIGCKNSKETGVGTEDGETWCAEEEEESHKQEHLDQMSEVKTKPGMGKEWQVFEWEDNNEWLKGNSVSLNTTYLEASCQEKLTVYF